MADNSRGLKGGDLVSLRSRSICIIKSRFIFISYMVRTCSKREKKKKVLLILKEVIGMLKDVEGSNWDVEGSNWDWVGRI